MKYKNIEMKIYECLGVNIFRKYILFSWEKIANFLDIDVGYRIKDMSIDSLKKYKFLSKGYAFTHLGVLIFFIVMGIINPVDIVWWVVNIGLNSYCIMVQRYNHIRINRLINIKKCREKKNQELAKYNFEQKENSKIIKPQVTKNNLSNSNISNLESISLSIKKCEQLIQELTSNNEENKDDSKVLRKTMLKK